MGDNTATNRLSMDRIMDASFGEVSNKLTVTFKKTVLIRDYETEVIEATSTVEFDHPLVGIERMFVTGLIQVQLEYTAYISLQAKGLVTQSEMAIRKKSMEEELYSIKYKADQILGPGVIDKYLDYTNLDK
jgi:hypothetical protein